MHDWAHRYGVYCTFNYGKIMDIATVSFSWIIHFWFFWLISAYKASLALYAEINRENQKWIIHEKLTVATSEREGKLSNPRAAPRACDAWRKFTEIYGNPCATAARALCIDFLDAKCTAHSGTAVLVVVRRTDYSTHTIKMSGIHTSNTWGTIVPKFRCQEVLF